MVTASRMWKTLLFIVFFVGSISASWAQEKAMIYGNVTDSAGTSMEGVNVEVVELREGTTTDEKGDYELRVPAGRSLTLRFSYLNSFKQKHAIPEQEPLTTYELNVVFPVELSLEPVEIMEEQGNNENNLTKVDPKNVDLDPSVSGGVENVLKTLPGVSSNSELSSSYSVRGGNYNENLVYINGVEVYRPFLVNSGQQEGLSIINPDLVQSIDFSAGGFEAKYGDKMASVLDIDYKQPTEFGGSVSGSLLGADAHVEGSADDGRFTYLAGLRYHNTQYLLNSLDVEGDYKPSYTDFQSYLTYNLTSDLQLGLLTHYGRNRYITQPTSRETSFGTPNRVLQLRIFFEGSEILEYQNLLNALSATYHPDDRTTLRFIASSYITEESEQFDILGQYFLDEIDTDPSSEDFQEPKASLGVGTFLNHARNRFNAQIYSFQQKGETIWGDADHELKWGLRYQYEALQDELVEWRLLDSSGYSLPRGSNDQIKLDRSVNNEFELANNRFSGYLQNTFTLDQMSNAYLTTGVRAHFWDFNKELLLSPRVQFVFEPNRKYNQTQLMQNKEDPDLKSNLKLRAAAGAYHQPPFYREFRDRDGNINKEIEAQKSYHFVLGSEMYVNILNRPFKWSTELYLKYMEDLIPYDIEDVRIRYFAENSAVGYATGIDMRLHGEFVRGLPSWASLSVMQTKEKIDGDEFYTQDPNGNDSTLQDPGFIKRPTDQRLQVGLFFQDFLPKFPKYKVSLNLQYGTGLPYGPPGSKKFRNQLTRDAYKRVDIGFSRLIGPPKDEETNKKVLKYFDRVWITANVFNLFGVQNTISHFWVRDTRNNQYAVPNFLTGRRINLKLKASF